MAKKNKLKKTTGFDIMYRTVTAALAVAMFPVFIFSNLLHYEIDHSALSGILSIFTGKEDAGITAGSFKLSELFMGEKGALGTIISKVFGGEGTAMSDPVYRPVIIAAVLLILALAVALVILGFAVASNKVKVITCLSAAGIALTAAAYFVFTNLFAKPVMRGEIKLGDLMGGGTSLLSGIIGMLGNISVFRLDSAFFGVFFLMIGIFIWSLAVIIVNAGEEKEKKVK